MRAFAAFVVLGVGLTLPAAADALAGNWLGAGPALEAAQVKPVIQVKSDKQQQEKNKACGPGKVFVKNEGCVKREKAEKLKEKSKQPPAKQPPAKTTKSSCNTISLDEKVREDLRNACTTQHPGADFSCAGFETSRRCCCHFQE